MTPPPKNNIAILLLAAGRSRRFGSDKLSANFRGKPLWEWSAIAAESAGSFNRYIVVGPHSTITPWPGWHVVLNSRAEEGMGTSIAAGVFAAQEASRIVIALADMPLIEPSHLRALALTDRNVFTRYGAGGHGCPAGFNRGVFPQLQALRGNVGAKSLGALKSELLKPQNPGTLVDIDTPVDL